jgi:type II secretory pathway component HofQ
MPAPEPISPKTNPSSEWITRPRSAIVLLLCLLAGGCSDHQHHLNTDLDALLASYRAENEKLEANRQEVREQGIRTLAVVGRGPQALVSADLANARLDVVVEELLSQAGVDYVSDVPRLLGTTTARFERRPLVEALAGLLGSRGLTATVESGLVRIHPGTDGLRPHGQEEEADESPQLSLAIPLSFEKAAQAAEVLDGMFPADEDDVRLLQFAARPETNSIFVSGPRQQVEAARLLLRDLDSDPSHVLLEALVVEFNAKSFLDLGSQIENGAKGKFSDFFFDVADLVGRTVSFTRVADAANSTAFSAALNLLIQEDQARILSRPYVATRSGSNAHLEVTEDRFVVVATPGDIDVTLESISSGVILDLLPVVTADGTILLDIAIDESQFVPTLENVEQRRSRATIKTFTQIQTGQTVVIGGLMFKSRAESVAGLPWLRRIPPFSLFFGHQDSSHDETQVMIFVTPHLWEPGMDTPFREKSGFEIYQEPDRNIQPGEAPIE